MLSYVDPAVSVEDATTYAEARGWTNWGSDEDAQTQALRRSQDYIAATYNGRWSYSWAFEDDDMPEEVGYAIIEGARRELVSPGSLSPDVTPGTIKQRVRVEGAVDVTYATGSGSASSQRPDISIIANLLAPYITNGGASVDVLRV